MKKRIGIIISSIMGVLIVGAITLTLISNKKSIDSKKEVIITESVIAVTVEDAKMKEVGAILNLVGTAKANREVLIPTECAGKIIQLNFKLGDFVSQGAVLARVEDTYKNLALQTAQLNLDKFKDDYQRFSILREGDAVTEMQLRDMKLGLENAEVQFKNAKKQLEDTYIRAPFSGVITSKNTELGAYVNLGAGVAAIADIAQLKVVVEVSESNVYNLRQSMEAIVSTEAYPGVKYQGRISSISPQGTSSHSFPVEIGIANSSQNPLKAGTYVNVEVNTWKTGSVLMIPRDAIVSSVKSPSVYVVRDNVAHLTNVIIGQDHGTYIEITSGVKEGDKVVTNGQINLMNGVKVSIINN